jgi:hypothetical protein
MTITIDRHNLIAEELIRTHIRNRIKTNVQKKTITEHKIRKVIRQLLETETGTEEASQYTGINVLADLLKSIIPTVEDDYKMLTTSLEQRESFRNHIVHAIKNTLRPLEVVDQADKDKTLPENYVFEIDSDILLEKMSIDISPEGEDEEPIEGEFIDIETEEEDEFVNLNDQNETGRNFASTTFKAIEKQIVDAYDMLADEEDQNLFYDYLLTNMLLYFDKFEDSLAGSLPDSTTPEYEEEKAEAESEEAEVAISDTESTESPAAETGVGMEPEPEPAGAGPSGDG